MASGDMLFISFIIIIFHTDESTWMEGWMDDAPNARPRHHHHLMTLGFGALPNPCSTRNVSLAPRLSRERIPAHWPLDHHLSPSSLGLSDATCSMLHAAESRRSLNPKKLRPRHSVPSLLLLLLLLLLLVLLLRFGTAAEIDCSPSASSLAGSHVSDDGMSALDTMICVSKSK
jgi:hypothetical protein